MKDILAIRDLGAEDLEQILALRDTFGYHDLLDRKGVALYFEKPSARTRNSMEMAVVQLGGHPVYIQKDELGPGTRETVRDVARTLACYHQIIAARVSRHALLTEMADATHIPILNMLSDTDHPLQALADLMTIREMTGRIEGVKVAYVGDANNVCRSLAEGCSLLGAELVIASPEGYGLPDDELQRLDNVRQVVDPREAVEMARFVYTDVWVSMGQDEEADIRRQALADYQVNEALLEESDDAWFLHCLPARRGEEVTDEVMEGERSLVWMQAENRMHAARAALAWMMGAERV